MIFDEKYFDFENGEVKIKPFQFTHVQRKSYFDSFSWPSALAIAKSAPMLTFSGVSSFLLPLLSEEDFKKWNERMMTAAGTCYYTYKNNEELVWTVGKIGGGMVIGYYVVPMLATTVGFSSMGIAPLSWAAKYQSTIGNIPPETWFAALQSAGAKQTLGIVGIKAGGVVASVDSYLRNSK